MSNKLRSNMNLMMMEGNNDHGMNFMSGGGHHPHHPGSAGTIRRNSSSSSHLAMLDMNAMGNDAANSAAAVAADKVIVYMGDGWCTFPDLDNFDSDKLLRALTLKESDSGESIWDPAYEPSSTLMSSQAAHLKSRTTNKLPSSQSTTLSTPADMPISISAQRQLEALFNLTQLLFGLSRAETVNFTFRDLQFSKHPHSFKRSGFKKIKNDGRVDFYAIFEELVRDIIDQGGLDVAFMMYKNPQLPMVRQKVLDLVTNVATVPEVAYKIMLTQTWFLDHLLKMIRDGNIVSDKIPALSVLIRLLKVMLTERMEMCYRKLVDMQYIDYLIDIFQTPLYTTQADYIQFFIKFESIAMQSLTVILGDRDYSAMWSENARVRLVNYCMIILLKAINAYRESKAPGGPRSNNNGSSSSNNSSSNSSSASMGINNNSTAATSGLYGRNHIIYAEKNNCNHSLAFAIITLNELLRNDSKMRLYYRHHKLFKRLIVCLYKKYSPKSKSQFSYVYPGISYALNHLMRVLFLRSTSQNAIGFKNKDSIFMEREDFTSSSSAVIRKSREETTSNSGGEQQTTITSQNVNFNNEEKFINQPPRTCSNPTCENEETKFKPFKSCSRCDGRSAAYCSGKCRKAHIDFHLKNECIGGGFLEHDDEDMMRMMMAQGQENNAPSYFFESVAFSPSNPRRVSDVLDLVVQTGDTVHQSLSRTKRLSKYTSMNDNNNRRNSLNFVKTSNANPVIGMNQEDDFIGQNSVLEKLSSLPSMLEGRTAQQQQGLNSLMSSSSSSSAASHYAKHANSMREVKPTKIGGGYLMETGDTIRSKLLSNSRGMNDNQALTGQDSSVNFVRPLKTSTAVCLTNLKSRSGGDNSNEQRSNASNQSNDSTSSSSKASSSRGPNSNQVPPAGPKRRESKERQEQQQQPKAPQHPGPKRRHSTTSSFQQTTTKTTTMTQITTKTKIKATKESRRRVSDHLSGYSSSSSSSDEADYNSEATANTDNRKFNNNNNNYENENQFFYEQPKSNEEKHMKDLDVSDSSDGKEGEEESEEEYEASLSEFIQELDDIENNEDEILLTAAASNENRKSPPKREMDDDDAEETLGRNGETTQSEVEAQRRAHTGSSELITRRSESAKIDSIETSAADYLKSPQESRRELGINSDFQNTLRAEEGGNGRSNNLSSFSSTSIMKKKQPSLNHEPGEMSFDSLKYCALTIQMKEQPAKTSASLKQPQFIIDNSVYSQVSANYRAPMASKDVSDEEEVDDDETQDEVISFNKENYESNKNKNEEFTTFKVPQVPPLNPVDNLPVSLRPINNVQPNTEYLFKKNKVYNELKVFSNLSNLASADNTTIQLSELPKNSTPILADVGAQAILNARRKQLLNAKLDLTITPGLTQQPFNYQPQQHQQLPVINTAKSQPEPIKQDRQSENRRSGKFLIPKLPSFRSKQQPQQTTSKIDSEMKTSTLIKSVSGVDQMKKQGAANKMPNILELSRYSAHQNFVASSNIVSVPKAELPKGIRKRIKDEVKTNANANNVEKPDRSRCTIQ